MYRVTLHRNMAKKLPVKSHYVAEWRAYRRLSLRQLALRLEYEPGVELLSASSLSRVEKGEQALTPDLMYALADALNCGPEDLIVINPLIRPELIDFMEAVRRLRNLPPAEIPRATKLIRAIA